VEWNSRSMVSNASNKPRHVSSSKARRSSATSARNAVTALVAVAGATNDGAENDEAGPALPAPPAPPALPALPAPPASAPLASAPLASAPPASAPKECSVGSRPSGELMFVSSQRGVTVTSASRRPRWIAANLLREWTGRRLRSQLSEVPVGDPYRDAVLVVAAPRRRRMDEVRQRHQTRNGRRQRCGCRLRGGVLVSVIPEPTDVVRQDLGTLLQADSVPHGRERPGALIGVEPFRRRFVERTDSPICVGPGPVGSGGGRSDGAGPEPEVGETPPRCARGGTCTS